MLAVRTLTKTGGFDRLSVFPNLPDTGVTWDIDSVRFPSPCPRDFHLVDLRPIPRSALLMSHLGDSDDQEFGKH